MEMAVEIKNSLAPDNSLTSLMETLGSIQCSATVVYNQLYLFKQLQNKWQRLKMALQLFNSSSLWCIITTTIIIITPHQHQ
jgi:hypothetical protein